MNSPLRVVEFVQCVSPIEGLARCHFVKLHLRWTAKLALLYDFVSRMCAYATVANVRRDEVGSC